MVHWNSKALRLEWKIDWNCLFLTRGIPREHFVLVGCDWEEMTQNSVDQCYQRLPLKHYDFSHDKENHHSCRNILILVSAVENTQK